jgi:hypothetical protein
MTCSCALPVDPSTTTSRKKKTTNNEREEQEMLSYQYHVEMQRQRRHELRRGVRRYSNVPVQHPARRGVSHNVSRAVGRLMIDVGSRLAADPLSERARSR